MTPKLTERFALVICSHHSKTFRHLSIRSTQHNMSSAGALSSPQYCNILAGMLIQGEVCAQISAVQRLHLQQTLAGNRCYCALSVLPPACCLKTCIP